MNITLALGGGGVKGNAHIGVIRRLEIEGFKINSVAGTSFGGIVAVFHGLGYTPDEIEQMFIKVDQSQLFGRGANEGPSLLGLAGATRWLESVIGARTFADLNIPCAITAADLKSGSEITLSTGPLLDAILATIALPGIFPARHIGEMELIDGGTLNPVPVAPARLLSPKLPVIAVVLNLPMGFPAESWNIPLPDYIPHTVIERLSRLRYTRALDVFLRSIDLMTRAVNDYRLEADNPDVIIRPVVEDIDILDRVDVREVVRRGEDAVDFMLPELKKLFAWQSRLRRAVGV
ncbi:MAG TPA: hypothetical protein DCX53_00225 [Anaerolineae bacterium]|nr:hypothetical protein [Anaerolineae bacterium]